MAAARARRRAAVFGDDPWAGGPRGSADEHDDADRAREGGGDQGGARGEDRWWREQRPPHHDRP